MKECKCYKWITESQSGDFTYYADEFNFCPYCGSELK